VNLLQTLPVALRALMRNKTRSFLTILGVIIGMLILTSGSTRSGGMMGGMGSMPTLTWEDLEAVKREAPAVRYAAPSLTTKTSLVGDDGNWTTSVSGTTPEWFLIRNWRAAKGSVFSAGDVESGTKVIVLGETVVGRLFGSGVDPVGRTVRIRSTPFVVIGVLEKKGQSFMGQDYDDTAVIPVSAFRSKLQGGLQQFIAGVVMIGARSEEDTYRAQSQITMLMRDRHHINDPSDDDFTVRNLTEIANARNQGMATLTGLLAAVAVVSLFVGGIGIMNIMLVSVTERTREIGIRMAVGAKPWHVMAQFLVEAVTLSMAGGALGIGLGFGASSLLASKLSWAFVIRTDIVVVSFVFSAVVGIVFGLYPAYKASKLDPIEALRYE
jgi:putative ABC transport system permease protein